MFIICQLTKERGKTWFNIGVTQWRFFRQHEFSLKYLPLITSLYQNHYQNDNQIVHRCYMQTLLLIHDLCILRNDIHYYLLFFIHYLLLPASLQSLSFGCRFPHLLSFRGPTSQELRAPKVLLEVCQVAFLLVLCSNFFILSAPLLTPFNSDMLSLRKFTINWRLQSKWQSMWQSKWLSLSLHLQMNNEYLNILHNIIFYQDVTVWHLLTVFGVTVWHLHKLWHGNGTF